MAIELAKKYLLSTYYVTCSMDSMVDETGVVLDKKELTPQEQGRNGQR